MKYFYMIMYVLSVIASYRHAVQGNGGWMFISIACGIVFILRILSLAFDEAG